MKQIIVCFLCAIVMMLPLFAAETPELTLATSAAEPKRDEAFTVTIAVNREITYRSAAMIITADPERFTVESGEWELTGAILSDFDEEEHVAAIAYESEQTTEGALLTFTLRVKKEAPLGETAIVVTPVFKNGDKTVICAPAEQKITVSCTHVYGQWIHNEAGHWKECACGYKTELIPHSLQEQTQSAPALTEESEKVMICAECGFRITEPIIHTAPNENTNPLIGIVLSLAAVTTALILFFIWKAKRKGA